jgi:sec-independent protein translocase protein TatA
MVAVSIGGPEVLIVVGILVLLFGAKKLPELARSIGRSTSEFKKGIEEGQSASEEAGTSADSERRAERKAETAE